VAEVKGINVVLEDGTELSLSLEEAQSLYEDLKRFFGSRGLPIDPIPTYPAPHPSTPDPHPRNPILDPWVTWVSVQHG